MTLRPNLPRSAAATGRMSSARVYDRERGFKASKPTDPSAVVTVASLDASLTPQLLIFNKLQESRETCHEPNIRELNEYVSKVDHRLPQS